MRAAARPGEGRPAASPPLDPARIVVSEALTSAAVRGVAEARAIVARHVDPRRDLAAELIAERRKETSRE